MTFHPSVQTLVRELEELELHASRSGREVLGALFDTAIESDAKTITELSTELERTVELLLTVLPAYAPPINMMHRLLSCIEDGVVAGSSLKEVRDDLSALTHDLKEWSNQARADIAQYGARLISEGSTVLTFTLSETISYVLHEAKNQGKTFVLRVSESRPNNDGLVTAQRAYETGISAQVSIDASIQEILRGVDLVLVGAEAIQADGSAICKIGTYPTACVASEHELPLYVIADTLKFNPVSLYGLEMPLQELASD